MKFPHATLIICPKQMVIEWTAAIGRDAPGHTVLQHHGDYDLRLSWSKCSAPEHLRVVVTTVETLKARWKKSRFFPPKEPRKHKAPPSRLWWEEKGVRPEFSRIVIDEAHRHNGAGARKATSGHKDFWRYLQSFEAKTHWFLSATPITTKVEDLRWVCKFLERPEMLRDNAANVWIDPTAADNRLEFVEGSETIVYDPEVIAKGSLVHCTLKAWDRHLQPDADTCSALQDWIKERQIQQPDGPDQDADSDDGLVEWQEELDRLQAILTDRLGHFLESVMLRRSMDSRIPFDSDRTILKVPAMEIRTEALPCDATDKPIHDTVFRGHMGNNPHRAYRYIRIVAMAPVLGPWSMMDPETHQVLLDTVYSSWDPDVNEVRKCVKIFLETYPQFAGHFPSSRVRTMTNNELAVSMAIGSPKLKWLMWHMAKLHQRRPYKKVILWTYWPLSQWFVEQFLRLLGYKAKRMPAAMTAAKRKALQEDFNRPGGQTQVLCLSYRTSNEGLNLHEDCCNTVLMELGNSSSQETQAWSRVRRIGQTKSQTTLRLINSDSSDAKHEETLKQRANPTHIALGILKKMQEDAGESGKGLSGEDIYNRFVGKKN